MTPDQVATALTRAVGALVDRGVLPPAPGDVVVERAQVRSEADWASPFALQLAPAVDPAALARLLDQELAEDEGIAAVGVTDSGHLTVTLVDRTPGRVALDVLEAGASYGATTPLSPGDWDAGEVQYAASRAASLQRNAVDLGVGPAGTADPALLDGVPERRLLDSLAEFPLVTEAAVRRDQPERLTRHLDVVADRFLDVHAAAPVLPRGEEAPTPVHRSRLLLVAATRQVLVNGLEILGLPAPERM